MTEGQEKAIRGKFIGTGIALGVAIGAGIGIAIGNLALGIAPGIAIGVALGAGLGEKEVQAKKGSGDDSKRDTWLNPDQSAFSEKTPDLSLDQSDLAARKRFSPKYRRPHNPIQGEQDRSNLTFLERALLTYLVAWEASGSG